MGMRLTFLLKKKSKQKKTLPNLSSKFAKKIKQPKENMAKYIRYVCTYIVVGTDVLGCP